MTLNLPAQAGPDRERAILDLIRQGAHEVSWALISSQHNGHEATFQVMGDALKIEGVRVNVSAKTQQEIADLLGCLLLTPKLADLAWIQRDIHLPPFPRGNTNGMSSTQAMLDHSTKIDKALAAGSQSVGLLGTVGKHWVIDNDLAVKKDRAMNYGWHFEGTSFQGIAGEPVASLQKDKTGQYLRLIQGRGTAHDMSHVDYSQICVLVNNECTLDGQPAKLSDILVDPELAGLASHQGVMKVLRQPGALAPRDLGLAFLTKAFHQVTEIRQVLEILGVENTESGIHLVPDAVEGHLPVRIHPNLVPQGRQKPGCQAVVEVQSLAFDALK